MNIYVNSEKQEVQDGQSLGEVLEQLALSSRPGIAVALNDIVVERGKWADTPLGENDAVLVITAAQGG